MITILIPSYNHINYVVGCIQAAVAVDLPGRKILIIDDGSTDGSVEVIKDLVLSLNDDSIEFVSKQNAGLVSSLNLGLSMVKTEFCYLVASDDLPQSVGIKSCLGKLVGYPASKFVIGGAFAFYEDDPDTKLPVYGPDQERFFSLSPEVMVRDVFLNYPSPILLQSVVFRTQALNEIGGWDPNLMLDDYPTFVKLFARFPTRNIDFFYLPESIVVGYRQHQTNSYKNVTRQYLMVQALIKAMAPESIKTTAISQALAGYIISAVKSRKLGAISIMLEASELRHVAAAVPAFIRIIGRKILSKMSRS